MKNTLVILFVCSLPVSWIFSNPENSRACDGPVPKTFSWSTDGAILGPPEGAAEDWLAIKDPSIVQHDGQWHLFCTLRGRNRSHAIVYLSFTDWEKIAAADQHVLSCHSGYYCAPQVFYFTPHKLWYMICQASKDDWSPKYKAAYSTTSDISDPHSWASLKPLEANQADGKSGLDFWVICDDTKAHLFFTTLDGRMWRQDTPLADFPHGWSEPVLALKDDIFEASHTYKLQGSDSFLTLIEAQGTHGTRYFKAYQADQLDGVWRPLATGKDRTFANMLNVHQSGGHWTDSISHGELLRAGFDQRLEVSPVDFHFLFQGVLRKDQSGKKYGQIPWRLGVLK